MRLPITSFWGKAWLNNETHSLEAWHPLRDHCIDVATVFRALVGISSIRQRVERAAGHSLSAAQLDRLAIIALLHDLGKLNLGFQGKVFSQGDRQAGHVREVAPLFQETDLFNRLVETLDLFSIIRWFGDEEAFSGMLLAAVSHHGRPVTHDELENRDARYHKAKKWWRTGNDLDPWQGMKELMDDARAAFPEAFEQSIPSISGSAPLQHRFAGLVMLADWIGSHVGFFPYRKNWQENRTEFARTQALHALKAIGFDTDAQRQSLQEHGFEPAKIFGFTSLVPLQQHLNTVTLDSDKRLLIAESETGSGKTEAAVIWFLRLFTAGAVDGLYFALPTRVAARELYERVFNYIDGMTLDPPLSPVLLAVPGYVRADGERILPESWHLWQDSDAEHQRERIWAAENPKRFLAAPVAIGTVDQALLSALRVKHAHLRSVCLDRQLLVIDEVHASDPYLRYLLQALLKHHLQLGGYALLLSATLGEVARAQWLNTEPLPLVKAQSLPYPSLASIGHVPKPVTSTRSSDKTVTVEFTPDLEHFEVIVERIVAALHQGARVLVVMNTVNRAIRLQRLVERDERLNRAWLFCCENIICPHHGRYARVDRESLDAAVSFRFGKGSAPGPILMIGTQTLEQSLDIDADLLITDHCPMDVLLQRIGRLHRHGRRVRPLGFEKAHCIVLSLADASLESLLRPDGTVQGIGGLGSVYSDLRVLRLTRDTFATHAEVRIPRDNRWLVEQALHPERLDLLNEGAWAKHAQKQDGIALSMEVQADIALIRPEPFGELRFSDCNEQLRTRLGLNDRRVTIPEPLVSPFGKSFSELIIPGHLAPQAEIEEVTELERGSDGIHFRLGGSAYCYTRFGLERLP